MRSAPTVVVGAGPAGLAAAAMLRRAGVEAIVLERDRLGASWRRHYDRLHLHTVRWLSHLPGYRFSREHGRWVSRDGVVRYLERYARHHELDVRTGVEVQRLERLDEGWSSTPRAGRSAPRMWSSRPATTTRPCCLIGRGATHSPAS